MNRKKSLTRSTTDRWVAGVCGGIAEHFGWPSHRVRMDYVLISTFSAGFPGMLVYLTLWYVLPEEKSSSAFSI